MQRQETVGVERADIAGAQPAVPDRVLRRGLVPPVSEHHSEAGDRHEVRITDLQPNREYRYQVRVRDVASRV